MEFLYRKVMGQCLMTYDSLVRVGFEFLPVDWLRVYRLLKNWVVNPPSGSLDEKTSMLKDLRKHWLTILTATGLVVLVASIHMHTNPHLMFILFYAIPCALLALVVNTRWATLFVLASSLFAPFVQYEGDPDYQSQFVFVWNFITRFILLEILVLTLGRIRLEFRRMSHQEK
jgi:hypothetical protein